MGIFEKSKKVEFKVDNAILRLDREEVVKVVMDTMANDLEIRLRRIEDRIRKIEKNIVFKDELSV